MDGAAGSGRHRALIGASDSELVDGTVAFVCAGLDAGEPVVVVCSDETTQLLQQALPDRPQVVWTAWSDVYGNGPAAAITAVRRLGVRHRVAASPVVRVVLEPLPGSEPETWREWQRYEAVLDHQLGEADRAGDDRLLVLCLCDTRRVPTPLVDAVRATHPMLQVDGHEQVNPDHVAPEEYLASLPVPLEPLESTEPLVHADSVRDLRGLRRDLAARAAEARLPSGSQPALEDFLLAVDEMTTNALRHGRPPVDLRLWAGGDRLVCTVTDHGAGLQDPFIGYGPAHGDDLSLGGMGLWLARQLCDHVDITVAGEGVQVRLTTVLR